MYTQPRPHTEFETDRTRTLRIGGGAAIVGSILVAGFRLAHGDLPAYDAHAAVHFINAHPAYAGVHIGAFLGVLICVGALVALAASFQRPTAALLGRLGLASVLVGAPIFAIEHITDGVAGQTFSNAWEAAGPREQHDLELAATTVFTFLRGPSMVGIITLFGLSLVLYGLAIRFERYPSWVGVAGVGLGGLVVIGSIGLLIDADLFPGVLVYGLLVSLLVQLWILTVGVFMLRRAAWAG